MPKCFSVYGYIVFFWSIEAYSDYIISKWEFYFGEKAKFKDI